jgi:hypothetical protein
VVQATADESASGLIRRLDIDLEDFPVLQWQWRIREPIASDPTKKAGDDFPARIYVTFAYEPSQVRWTQRARYRAARALYGDVPYNSLIYVWDGQAAEDTVFASPYAPHFVKSIVARSGDDDGTLHTETRNVYDDYVRVFGGPPPRVTGVAIMTDTDNTGTQATAWYGGISFLRRDPAAADDSRACCDDASTPSTPPAADDLTPPSRGSAATPHHESP